MNREQRRHPDQTEEPPGHAEPKHDPDEAMRGTDRQQEDLSVRAKNTGHKKKTADKWNQ